MQSQVIIDAPLRGEWAILNPPGHAKLAFDFLASRGSRLPYRGSLFLRHLLLSIGVADTYAWGQPVYAPLDGTVVACWDGAPDRERISMIRDLVNLSRQRPPPGAPFQAYGGNYVVLQCGDVYPLLAHLRCGSVRVKLNDRVASGDLLGEVGNSGLSLQPHLHFQVMSSENPFPLFENLVPFRVRELRKRLGGAWKTEINTVVADRDHLLFN